MLSKHIKLNQKESKQFIGGDVMEILVEDATNKSYNLIFGDDILFRILRRASVMDDKKLKLQTFLRHKDLTSADSLDKVNQILSTDNEIKGFINSDLYAVNKPTSFDDKLTLIQKKTAKIKKLQKSFGTNFLIRDKISVCDQCKAFRFGQILSRGVVGTSVPQSCPICQRQINKSQDIYCLPNSIHDFLSGEWFEHYATGFFLDKGWKVFVRTYVFGTSGVEHEIDLLAIKKGVSIIVECKSGSVPRREVSNFIAKYYDIRCNYAMLLSVKSIDKNTLKFVRKNPNLLYLDDIKTDVALRKKVAQLDKDLINL